MLRVTWTKLSTHIHLWAVRKRVQKHVYISDITGKQTHKQTKKIQIKLTCKVTSSGFCLTGESASSRMKRNVLQMRRTMKIMGMSVSLTSAMEFVWDLLAMMGRYSESAACCGTQETGINETNKRIKMTMTDDLIKKERKNCVPNHKNITAVRFNVAHSSGALSLTLVWTCQNRHFALTRSDYDFFFNRHFFFFNGILHGKDSIDNIV